MTINNWLTFIEIDVEKAFYCLQSWDEKSLNVHDGWYKVYSAILNQRPEYSKKIPFYKDADQKCMIYDWYVLFHKNQRLTKEQSNDLRRICAIQNNMRKMSKI